MNFFINNDNLSMIKTDCIVLGIFKSNIFSQSAEIINNISNNYISDILKKRDFYGNIGETLLLYELPNLSYKRILLVGCGKNIKITVKKYKKILQSVLDSIKKIVIKNLFLCLVELYVNEKDVYWKIRIIIEIITNYYYIFNKFKSNKKIIFSSLKNFFLNIQNKYELQIGKIAIKHAMAISIGLKAAKDLANMPPNKCTPNYLLKKSVNLSKKNSENMSSEIVSFEEMKKIGMLAFASVGQSSINKPAMIIIKYNNIINEDNKPIVLIGKGVTFDSGGISIKPSRNMHEMKYDMSGAAAVYGIMLMLSELKLPLNVIGILAASENMPGGSSFKPGDIIRTMSGKTVEILDTDAEGRLILCDVLTYIEKFSPEIVIDISTLTGACVVALGHVASGLLSNNNNLVQDLLESGKVTDDKVWHLPIFSEYYNELKSNIADIRNIGTGNAAGAITAACFLSNFAKKYQWAHLDIAGTAWISGNNITSTGRPVTLLSQFLLQKALTNMHF